MAGTFDCCRECKPPRRTDVCHCTCVDYIIEKAFSDADRDERFRRSRRNSELNAQFIAGVERANKRRKGR